MKSVAGERRRVWTRGLDSRFTPFLPFRSFLYCSFNWAISPWSTSQDTSARGDGSSFSAGGRGSVKPADTAGGGADSAPPCHAESPA